MVPLMRRGAPQPRQPVWCGASGSTLHAMHSSPRSRMEEDSRARVMSWTKCWMPGETREWLACLHAEDTRERWCELRGDAGRGGGGGSGRQTPSCKRLQATAAPLAESGLKLCPSDRCPAAASTWGPHKMRECVEALTNNQLAAAARTNWCTGGRARCLTGTRRASSEMSRGTQFQGHHAERVPLRPPRPETALDLQGEKRRDAKFVHRRLDRQTDTVCLSVVV